MNVTETYTPDFAAVQLAFAFLLERICSLRQARRAGEEAAPRVSRSRCPPSERRGCELRSVRMGPRRRAARCSPARVRRCNAAAAAADEAGADDEGADDEGDDEMMEDAMDDDDGDDRARRAEDEDGRRRRARDRGTDEKRLRWPSRTSSWGKARRRRLRLRRGRGRGRAQHGLARPSREPAQERGMLKQASGDPRESRAGVDGMN